VTRRPSSPERELHEGIAFALQEGIGCVAFRERVERHGSAAAAFRQGDDAPAKRDALNRAEAAVARARALGITILVQGEPGYPPSLLDLPDAPRALYALGSVALLERRRVGIVGTRHSSTSGERIAQQIAARFVEAGMVVVSGMAFGIDAAAHRGALDAGGGTIAVLGGGVDLPYPPSHAILHGNIARDGLVLAEAPIGSRPVKGAFPKRNRIIAALSETLIVVEAGDRSGALITSRLALELGRTVAAVPGPIDSPRHLGSNRLLADGASFIGSIDDALSIAGVSPTEVAAVRVPSVDAGVPPDDPAHARILNAIRTGATDVEDLARSTTLAPRDFANALAMLELNGQLLITDGGSVSLSNG
jgi:DNA processing protein